MAYCTQADIENVFGVKNTALWSNLEKVSITDGTPAVITSRITAAIAYADAYLEDKFRTSRYAVPLSPINAIVTDWASKIAGVWLYETRGIRKGSGEEVENRVSNHREMVEDQIVAYLSGQRTLPCVKVETIGGTAPTIVS